jgi:hypothetical protein
VGSLVVSFAWADYTRKPRFRLVGLNQAAASTAAAEQRALADASAGWTYQTVSA